MTKKNYHAKKLTEAKLDKENKPYTTTCFRCDGYDHYCTKYIPLVQEYTSICITKVNLQPESRLEEMVK